jgi:DNA mismatch repair protein MutS
MKISLFKKGIYPEIDRLQEEIEKTKCSLSHFKAKVAEWMGLEKALKVFNVKKGTDIIHNKNRPISFKLSVSRFQLIDHYINEIDSGKERIFKFKSVKEFTNRNRYSRDEGEDDEELTDDSILTEEDIEIIQSIYKISRPGKSSTAKDVSFQSKIVSESSSERYELEEQMEKLCKEKYDLHIAEMDNEFDESVMEILPNLVAFIDVMASNAKCATKYAYNKPTVALAAAINREQSEARASFIRAVDVRNPIVERINTQIPFIPNDVDLGLPDSKGLLIFGLNDAGKSCYMRSVGLNLVMAQMGGFVAAKSFEFYPFKKILTRLSGQDNVYKGEGSFRVEMNEFRDISSGCDQNSLILGDELCRGTTYYDAISIVTAGIRYMVKKDTNYILTTHLHQLPELEEIQAIDSLKIKHLQVKRDPVTNVITYLRKLTNGPGDSFYGIEVARGCAVPEDILRDAERIRKKLIGKAESILDDKKSNFNARFFKRECAVCGKPSDETHHIKEQHEADENGIIDYFHKNAEHNLVWVCTVCHHKETHRDKNIEFVGYVMTTDGRQLCIKDNST